MHVDYEPHDPKTKWGIGLKLMCFLAIPLLVATLVFFITRPAFRRSLEPQSVTYQEMKYDAPTIVVSGRTPVSKLTGPVSPENNGFNVDLDGDGIDDFAILNGHELTWAKVDRYGHRSGLQIVVLRIQDDLKAYSFMTRPGDRLPSLLFWTTNDNGYYQTCLGLKDGIPYFGDVEAQ